MNLYFEEPVKITEAFSDSFHQMLKIVDIGNHAYKVALPDDNSNYFYYTNGLCTKQSHHRVHHGSDIEYLDKNHGGITIIWDKVFGTYQREIHRPKYGLTKNIGSYNPFVIFLYEWKNIFSDLKKAKTVRERINYLFNAPGWSSDGKSKTAKQLQADITHKDCKICSSNLCTKQMALQLEFLSYRKSI